MRPSAVARLLSDCFNRQIFCAGFVHCDPHPANVLVRPMPRASMPDMPANLVAWAHRLVALLWLSASSVDANSRQHEAHSPQLVSSFDVWCACAWLAGPLLQVGGQVRRGAEAFTRRRRCCWTTVCIEVLTRLSRATTASSGAHSSWDKSTPSADSASCWAQATCASLYLSLSL